MKTALFILAISVMFIPSIILASDSVQVPVNLQQNSAADSTSLAGSTAKESGSNFVYPMPPDRKEKLIAYSRFNNLWRFAGFLIEVAIFLIVLYTGLSGKFRDWAQKISPNKFVIYLFYLIFLTIVIYALNFIPYYYRNYVVEHNYGFSNQSFGEWLGDSLKGQLIGFVFGMVIILILYWLINRFKKWWVYFAVGAIPIMIFVMIIYPVLVAPMFNKFVPIKNEQLRTEMVNLAEKAGIHNPDVYEVDASRQSSKVNAYFTGMFGTKRIVLYDTAINNFSSDELKFIMGHEIGHYLMNHIWYGMLLAIFLFFIAGYLADRFLGGFIRNNSRRFGFDRLGDVASYPLLSLFVTVFFFVAQPITNGASRYMEYKSDTYGLEISGVTGDEAATAFDKLSVFNLSDPQPPILIEYWFYDHPSLKKRMDRIQVLYNQMHKSGV
jgi:STE24 endopeptidase